MGNAENKSSSHGFRVIKVLPNSPAQKAGLVEFLDFITDISCSNDTTPFTGNYRDFCKRIQNCEDQEAIISVYNILHRKTRLVAIIPSKKWENSENLLGGLVRHEECATAHERVLRIATVYPNSPASIAGLQSETDYILGSPQYLYTDLNELANFIEMTQEKETIKSLEMFVYNSQSNSVRSTWILPNKNWGGAGYLGCEFGLGFLNHLPHITDSKNVSALDNSEEDSNGILKKAENLDLQQENSSLEDSNKTEEIPEFKLRPPTDSELDHNVAGSPLSSEAAKNRMKLLHVTHHHHKPIPPKPVRKPFIKSGRTAANPFHDPKNTENRESEILATNYSTNADEPTEVIKEKEKLSKENAMVQKVSDSSTRNGQAESQNNSELATSEGESSTKGEDNGSKGEIKKQSRVLQSQNSLRKTSIENQNGASSKSLTYLQEKQACKTTFEYNFFSKKLSGDYKILSTNLFRIDELSQIHEKSVGSSVEYKTVFP